MDEVFTLEGLREYWEEVAGSDEQFDGANRYVPYLYMTHEPDEHLPGNKSRYSLDEDDKALFPELKHRRAVVIKQEGDGALTEVR